MYNSEMNKLYHTFQGRLVYQMTPEEKAAPISKQIGEGCRHIYENAWYVTLIIINTIMIISVLIGLVYGVYTMAAGTSSSTSSGYESSYDNDSYDIDTSKILEDSELPWGVEMFIYGAIILLFGYVGLYYYFAYYRSMSLRITEHNFPEVYYTIQDYSRKLGIEPPKAYVMQSNGVLNAFSTFIFGKQWIMINSEVFEVAYREHKDMDSLNFIIAHELAHIYYGHATLHYNLPIWFSSRLPLVSAIASRCREYSCDRLAQRLTGVDGIRAMLVLVVDRHLYKHVDINDYLSEMSQQKGFFIWLVNLLADHPVMCKRVIALYEGVGSGKLF